MNIQRVLLLLTFSFCSLASFAQNSKKNKEEVEDYGIDYDDKQRSKSCIECLEVMASMPSGVGYGLYRSGNTVYFGMTDKNWYEQVFTKNSDGIAVDIIQRSQFKCKIPNKKPSGFIIGVLCPPVYLKQMNKLMFSRPEMDVLIPVAELPKELAGEIDLEFNMVLLKGKAVCHYIKFFDIPQNRLQLLAMDIYMDTSAFDNTGGGKKLNSTEKEFTTKKKLEFVIPFEKNKFDYKPSDLQPVYDSLKLNYFDIKSMQIRAYSSIEGSLEKNIELQNRRAQSILQSLQTFQKLKIINEITTSENWVEFLNDISNTPFASLQLMEKEEIKAEIEKKKLGDRLEPILKNHRKAVLFIELEKKSTFKELSEVEIKKAFEDAIKSKNVKTALEIQQAIFQNIEAKIYNPSLLQELEIPESRENVPLLLNRLSYLNKAAEENLYKNYSDFQRLEQLDPQNSTVKYDLCVLELQILTQGELIVTRKQVYDHIQKLASYKIDPRLIRRLQINFALINTEYLTGEKNYAERDKSLNYIYQNYKGMNYSDHDILRLAEYFVLYRKYQWALKSIEGRVNKIDVTEDLLFYYINLVINDEKVTNNDKFRAILLNAYNLDAKRFCALFGTAFQGGISFQLLDNKYLKKTYCENCEGK